MHQAKHLSMSMGKSSSIISILNLPSFCTLSTIQTNSQYFFFMDTATYALKAAKPLFLSVGKSSKQQYNLHVYLPSYFTLATTKLSPKVFFSWTLLGIGQNLCLFFWVKAANSSIISLFHYPLPALYQTIPSRYLSFFLEPNGIAMHDKAKALS